MADEELYDRIEELLDDSEAFWAIDVTDELIESLTLAYLDGLKGSAGYIGDLAGVGLELTFDLIDPVALKFIEERAAEMVRNVNNGTKHFLRTMIYNGVQEGISEQELIDGIYQNLFQQSDFSEQRIRSITRFEIARAQSDAWEKQMDEVGLETKRWVTIGADACHICKGNEAMGPQPINSKPYDNVFGEKCEGPPAHPKLCRCHLAATPSEIAGLGKDIEFYVGKSEVEKGGKGSGHWGHKGIKGRRGGSASSKGISVVSAIQHYIPEDNRISNNITDKVYGMTDEYFNTLDVFMYHPGASKLLVGSMGRRDDHAAMQSEFAPNLKFDDFVKMRTYGGSLLIYADRVSARSEEDVWNKCFEAAKAIKAIGFPGETPLSITRFGVKLEPTLEEV